MKRVHAAILVFLGCLGLVVASAVAVADDINPPPWRGAPHSVKAKFDLLQIPGFPSPPTDFMTGPSAPYPLSNVPPIIGDPFQDPTGLNAIIYPIELPNFIDPLPLKLVRVQYSWFAGSPTGNPNFPGDAQTVSLVPDPPGAVTLVASTPPMQIGDPLENIYYRYDDFEIRPNPDFERFQIAFIDVDPRWIIIDTISIPEPSTLALLGLVGVVTIGRLRRR